MRRVVAFVLAVSLTVLACGGGSSPARTPSGARASCASDAECAVTDSAGCCGCCPTAPAGIPKDALERREHKCRTVDCAACSADIHCPRVEPVSGFVAKCVEGTCAAVRRL